MPPATTSSDSPSWQTPPGARWQGAAAATRVTTGGTVVGVAIPPAGQIANARILVTNPTTGLQGPSAQSPLVRRLSVRGLLVRRLLVRGPLVRRPSVRGLAVRGRLVRGPSVRGQLVRGQLVRVPSVRDRPGRGSPVRDQRAVSGWREGPAPEPGVRVVRGVGAGAFARVETEAVPAGTAGDALHTRAEVVPSTAAGAVRGEAAYVPGADRLAEGLSVVGRRHREDRSCDWCPRPALTPTTRRRLVEVYDLRTCLGTRWSPEAQRKLGDRWSPGTRRFGRATAVRRGLFATRRFGPVGERAGLASWTAGPRADPVRQRARTRVVPGARASCPPIGRVCPGGRPASRDGGGVTLPHGSPDGGGVTLPYGSPDGGGPYW